jgi:hypothetical protein
VRTVGIVTVSVAAAVAIVAAVVGARSVHDVRRYLKIRSM